MIQLEQKDMANFNGAVALVVLGLEKIIATLEKADDHVKAEYVNDRWELIGIVLSEFTDKQLT